MTRPKINNSGKLFIIYLRYQLNNHLNSKYFETISFEISHCFLCKFKGITINSCLHLNDHSIRVGT